MLDNRWAESFNSNLMNERVNRTESPTRKNAREVIVSYIKLRYNQIRPDLVVLLKVPVTGDELRERQAADRVGEGADRGAERVAAGLASSVH
ncbi:hypothetical protein DFR76_102862 [Nocardia pseudobrasiliensis]|uniref:Uncharacterized protein n=1 Tax=Nocardia pseudobrasiliensis TaxID=45979 RepID=A0A370IEA8_9NOCA|nr:hypothetical protein DFR76_102862 [Nocardia pseudobrasiliensis]